MRGNVNRVRGKWSLSAAAKLGFPEVLFACFFFFIAGLYASLIISRFVNEVEPKSSLADEHVEYLLSVSGETGDDSITSIPFQVLSWQPRALHFPNFATAEQCQHIITITKSSLRPSTVALRKGETGVEDKQEIRTSSGVFIGASEDKAGVLDAIEEKIARATMLPRTHGEEFNVLRYEIGQKYDSHYDAFDPEEYGPQNSARVASFLLYLTDVEEGGETMFPFENGLNMGIHYDYQKCIGLKVQPRRGDALLFYSLLPNSTIDQLSLHGSCPVIKGEKWVATKWIRNQDLNYFSLTR